MTQKSFINYPKKSSNEIKEIIQKKSPIWKEYVNARVRLDKEGLVKTKKIPEADFSEWLCKIIFNGKPNYNPSQAYYDIETSDKKIQVKSINSRKGYILKESDKKNPVATHYAFVWFNDFLPLCIYLVSIDDIKVFQKKNLHLIDLKKISSSYNLSTFFQI